MDFKEATDRLSARLSAADIAEAFGVHPNTIARARVDASSESYRSPPDNWRAVLARLARARAQELENLADELRRDADLQTLEKDFFSRAVTE